MSQIWLKSSRKAKSHNALNISVYDIIIHLKKIKASPGAQFITHSALKFSEYVSNVTKKRQKSEIL